MTAAAVPQPRAENEPSAPAARGRRSSLAIALLAGALGAALVLLATSRKWAEGTASVAQGSLPQSANGDDITGLPGALAIVGLAALVAIFAVRRLGRGAVSALLALSGAGIVVSSALGATDKAALEEKASKVSGLTHSPIHDVAYTPWPWVAAAGGVLLLLAGVLALGYGRHWPAMSGRYERAGTVGRARTRRGGPAPDPDRPEELWKALDRGEDPTRAPARQDAERGA
ncbi:TIGR02234 family membrane protein [Streptomyces antimycoticus]|uniref:TIGR02234 family membrane protein n=1 Tax=Streptomyces TaxID=1883 RepID=UPI0021AF1261|nr:MULTISPECIES: TIGR02234 family membrane protein [Streptomyces]WJE00206.1 TIGR02234 family membrane protein [Streptomyces antimycoticus]WTA81048.1 TIGR02234 family membrane protein [Streptomyces antimycoticus]WTB08512.1 TIGR02234 family membrane protein [Streptomyces antimycoticus]